MRGCELLSDADTTSSGPGLIAHAPPTLVPPAPAIRLAVVAGLIVLGGLGGRVLAWAGWPMPYLIGGLICVGALAIALAPSTLLQRSYPKPLRSAFVAVIGVLIGASFSRDVLSLIPSLWISLTAMALFVVTTFALGYQLFRRVAGYDRVTALYAAMPGGLIEAVVLGEEDGADPKLLSLQHFARIVLVVLLVPLVLLAVTGEAIGPRGTGTTETGPALSPHLPIIAGLAALGMALGRLLRLPAAQLIGPLLVSAVAHGAGLVALDTPLWLLNLSQLIVGVGLGVTFSGATGRMMLRVFGMALLSVVLMLIVGALFAFALSHLAPVSWSALFISFAPGGVTEMALIALSLSLSPVIVTVHHLFRIVFTVFVVSLIRKRLRLRG